MSLRRLAVWVMLGALLLGASPAAASVAEAGLGADFMVDDNAAGVMATLALETPIARRLSVGGRFGVFLESDPSRLGVPLDARLRFHTRALYVDGLVGPWIFFREPQRVRFHGALGVGLFLRGRVSLGIELGYLDPSAMLGARFAFAF